MPGGAFWQVESGIYSKRVIYKKAGHGANPERSGEVRILAESQVAM